MTDWHEGPVDDWPKEKSPRRRHLAPPGECKSCDNVRSAARLESGSYFAPPHDASPNCKSGKHNHCTCSVCF